MISKWLRKWAYVIIWMAIIFFFSCQNGEASSNNNKFIEQILLYFRIDLNSIFNGNGSYLIRKVAHFTEYFILYYFVFNALNKDVSFRKNLIISLIFTFLYACSDEFHQSFTPGRYPSFKDVMIDTGGGTFCMVIKYVRHTISLNKKKIYINS
ncbi:phosphotransbutyrylase [Fervidicella metallireducens AeB]|uniref:Phosphotransbutyrylase n=1 Tax=Fervidicella metallireducens AeB TaxID=1403537 RepID=A0A017RTG7_9CLOT|nr:VanZ family protein [Fervidicella metallireducens]EYE87185.1 phosphotransbutyrylase [Fervidicella metallireducens AeB]